MAVGTEIAGGQLVGHDQKNIGFFGLGHYICLMKTLLMLLIRLYQITLSGLMGQQCRFLPTCSDYARQAIDKYGAGKGSILAAKRICKCHPWGGSGYDPVP
ncbi:MAG: membrane protein insertion efficiency factor YidD [Aestuariivirga sp.]